MDAPEHRDDERVRWTLRRRSKQVRTRPIHDAPATEEDGADASKVSRHREQSYGCPNKLDAVTSVLSVVRGFDAGAT